MGRVGDAGLLSGDSSEDSLASTLRMASSIDVLLSGAATRPVVAKAGVRAELPEPERLHVLVQVRHVQEADLRIVQVRQVPEQVPHQPKVSNIWKRSCTSSTWRSSGCIRKANR